MIHGMFNSGAMPALERSVQFTAERHKLLTDNIANLSTPGYRPRDLDPGEFQAALREAVEARRERPRGLRQELEMRDTQSMRFRADGIDVRAPKANQNILFHDQNDRDLDRTMQSLAENTLMHRASVELLKNQFEMLELAIRERM